MRAYSVFFLYFRVVCEQTHGCYFYYQQASEINKTRFIISQRVRKIFAIYI